MIRDPICSVRKIIPGHGWLHAYTCADYPSVFSNTFLAPRPHGLAGGAPLARPSPSPGVIIVMNHQELPDIVDVLEHVFAP